MFGGQVGGQVGGQGGGQGGGGYVGSLPFPIMGKPILGMNPPDFITGAKYPVKSWRPDLFALLGVAEFAKTGWQSKITSIEPKAFTDPSEERDLLALQANDVRRAERFSEILDQDGRLNVYFAHTLMVSPTAHPHTLRVLEMAYQIGGMIAVHFKDRWKRARPQQVCPVIHADHPRAGASVVSEWAFDAEPPDSGRIVAGRSARRAAAQKAGRAYRRESGDGVHFKSDSEEGERLATQAMTLLKEDKVCPIFMREVEAAKAEHQ
jgi:acid phosphatase (class A)